jgi:pimeloyl-ACP methyl ester carboxylesterase
MTSSRAAGDRPELPDPVSGVRTENDSEAGRLAIYTGGKTAARTPLLLIHSVNAAASAYEIKPLFDYYAGRRPVYALDLPGFGRSERGKRKYSIRLMTDAVHAATAEIRRIHGDQPIDAIALSLSCEFLARAAAENPQAHRSLGLISPTGFEGKARDQAGGDRGQLWLRRGIDLPLLGRGLFRLQTSRTAIRMFLQKTWGATEIDEGLADYAYLTSHQPGARHAPYDFVSGYLFGKDILNVYQGLSMPVWMAHGVRGDFVDYHHKTRVLGWPNWSIDILPTGAFPHFERIGELTRCYEGFLSQAIKPERRPPLRVIG